MTAGRPGFAVGLGLTNDCNLACAHCYRDTERVDRLSLADVRRVCDSLPIRAVNLGTGENALHPEFRAILHELHARGLVVTLTSNGYSASVLDDEELRWLRDVEFSLGYSQFVVTVQNGRTGKQMPPWKEYLTEQQISQIAAYLETLAIEGADWR